MKKSTHINLRPAALQRLIWSRGTSATWRTVAVFDTSAIAERALVCLPRDDALRVLIDLPAAMRIGALTRDGRPEVSSC